MIAPARSAALRVLQRVDAGATLADALARERDRLADPRDRALVTELATGTLRWLGRLDDALARHSTRSWTAVDPLVRHVLRLAAYQLLFLDRLPARAVVDDAVEQVRVTGFARATGFVNALLRALARTHHAAPPSDDASAGLPSPLAGKRTGDDLDALATTLSHPKWLLARWVARHGTDATRQWAAFNNRPPDLVLRVNRLLGSRESLIAALAAEGTSVEPVRFARDGVRVTAGQPLGSRAARAGLCVLQDEASQLVGELAAAFAGPRMLDACAAPGGKTLALRAGAPTGTLVAADRRPRRLRLLRETLERCGAGGVRLVQIDLARSLPFRDVFDLVLVDAPCSGLGTVRREPDIKWRRQETDLAILAEAQGRMLDRAAGAVAAGGHLVYSTCSSEPEENDDVVAAFLGRAPAFTQVHPLPDAVGDGVARVLDDRGCLRTLPHVHGLEAFFAVVLLRTR